MADPAQNPDGTWDGIAVMCRLSGLSRAEVEWTWARVQTLNSQGYTRKEALAKIRAERESSPWINSHGDKNV